MSAPSAPIPSASGTRQPLFELDCQPAPVPGTLTRVVVRPVAERPMRNPRTPTENPTPRLLRFTRKGPRPIDFRKMKPMRSA